MDKKLKMTVKDVKKREQLQIEQINSLKPIINRFDKLFKKFIKFTIVNK